MKCLHPLLCAAVLFAIPASQSVSAMLRDNPSGDAKKPAKHHVQSQGDLDDEAAAQFKAADREMNRVYEAILKKYAKDTVFIAKLKNAQRAWLAFRDAELAANYPDPEPQFAYGSVYPMCASYLVAELTRERTKQLKAWLHGTQEGDVCAGSIQINGDGD
jgi:uncharacterized protein YecT (DUF1311 family)